MTSIQVSVRHLPDYSNHYLKFDSFPIEEDNFLLLPQNLILQGP